MNYLKLGEVEMTIPYFDELDISTRKMYIEEELKKESSLKKILGYDTRSEVIHKDDMVNI